MRLFPIGLLLCVCSPLAWSAPRLVPPDDFKLLMIDPRVITSAENARLVPGQVSKEPRNPLFQADKPWENSMNNLYPNLLWDEDEKLFKLWYKCVLADPEAIAKMDRPSTVHDVGWYLLYATSADGLAWTKPALGLHAYDGNANTNIVARDTPNVGVFKDQHDPDPARRYKMVYDVGLGQVRARFSADGIHWSDPVVMQGFGAKNGDTHNNAFWDERTGSYLWFTKLYLGERLVARFQSRDFLNWTNDGLVLRSTLAEGKTSQTYCMPVFRYANSYLAWLMMYHPGRDRSVDCELAWSPDGLQWRRIFPGVPFLPRGAKGTYDSECIYAMAGPPVEQDGELLIFYGGDDFPHTGWKRHCLPCLARLPLDHFGGYEPVAAGEARLETRALQVHPDGLRLTAEAAGGSIEVSALQDGKIIAESNPLSQNGADLPITWRTGQPVSPCTFRIVLRNAKLFAMGGVRLVDETVPTVKVALPSPTPVNSRLVSFDSGLDGWTGVDSATHQAQGDATGGFLTVSRAGRNLPIARSGPDPFGGDWPVLFGGTGARIRCQVRSANPGGKVQIEVFAGDIAQWSFPTSTSFGPEWQEAVATLRYDWTDEEAKAAGWRPATAGFPWVDTIRNVGKVVVVPVAVNAQSSFDLDEVSVTGLAE